MSIERVDLQPDTDLRGLIENVRADKLPRLIERDGEPLAVVVSPDHFEAVKEPKSKRLNERMLSLAGVWSDLDADQMLVELDERRHATPPSRPIGE